MDAYRSLTSSSAPSISQRTQVPGDISYKEMVHLIKTELRGRTFREIAFDTFLEHVYPGAADLLDHDSTERLMEGFTSHLKDYQANVEGVQKAVEDKNGVDAAQAKARKSFARMVDFVAERRFIPVTMLDMGGRGVKKDRSGGVKQNQSGADSRPATKR